MMRKTDSGSHIITKALDDFRSGMNSSFPQKSSSETEIKRVGELGRKKIIQEFMPFIISNSTVEDVYDIVLELESGIQRIILDFLKTKVRQDASGPKDSQRRANVEEGSLRLQTNIKTENDMTSSTEDTECPAVAQIPGEENMNMEKLVSYVLDLSRDIRYHKNGLLGRVPTTTTTGGWGPVKRSELRRNIKNLKVFLKSGEFWAFSTTDCLQLHGRLVEVARFAGKALWNAYDNDSREHPGTVPPGVFDEDCVIWCMASDLDIRESFPSERDSAEFRREKVEFEMAFFNLLLGYLTEESWIIEEWKGNKDIFGQWLLDLVKSQIALKHHEQKVEFERPRPQLLRTEALYHLWELRRNLVEDSDSDSNYEYYDEDSVSTSSEDAE